MNKVLETAEKEVIRAEILSTCNMAAPEGADTKVLKAVVRKLGYELSEDDIKRQVDYLKQKSLVDTREIGNGRLGIQRTIVTITAAGIDYLEGNSPDIPGIGE